MPGIRRIGISVADGLEGFTNPYQRTYRPLNPNRYEVVSGRLSEGEGRLASYSGAPRDRYPGGVEAARERPPP